MTRLTLIIVSLVAGVALGVGAAFTVSGVLSSTPPPVQKKLDNYGGP